MHLDSLRIQNFRAFKDETIHFGPYAALVGANGAGKSTVLAALNVFFRNSASAATDVVRLAAEDFHKKNTAEEVVITATFGELSSEAAADLAHYVRHGKLIITCRARWDDVGRVAEVRQHGSRLLVPAFRAYYDLDESGASADALKGAFRDLRVAYPALAAETSKVKMKAALDEYSAANPDECEGIESADQFYGFTKGANKLERHVQWVYIPAVKEAASEQQESSRSALGLLLQRSVRGSVDFDSALTALRNEALAQYQTIVSERQSALGELASRLQATLRLWSHPDATLDLKWEGDPQRSVTVSAPLARADLGESDFSGDVARLGHGLQRSFILSVLQVLATQAGGGGPKLLLGIEEPELYQHPPQARHFAHVLRELGAAGTQVVLTTHSPYFVSARDFHSVRLVTRRSSGGAARVTAATAESVDQSVASALGDLPSTGSEFLARLDPILGTVVAEMFFCRVPIFVEGVGDVAIISAFLDARGRSEDFRRYGFHLVNCEGKVSASRPVAVAKELGVPFFVVFDGDKPEPDTAKEKSRRAANQCLLSLAEENSADPNAPTTFIGQRVIMWGGTIESVIRDAVGSDAWRVATAGARQSLGLLANVKEKNPILLAGVIDQLLRSGTRISPLEELEVALFNFVATASHD